ncbi:GntR family transcriptional regulator [Planctomicrobium sp. SH664]|uniref:GntR family transcriptional regulator n=1 Tax=Planctomicrobium sp. SH664 TaxID=3448125 RepID=UPI003F5C0EB9
MKMGSAVSATVSARPEIVAREKRKHEQVRQHLLREISLGNLRPGDVLPAEPDLAQLMGVSRTTIRQTLGDLEQEGHIRRVRGKGTFVAEQAATGSQLDAASFALIVPDMGSTYYSSLLSAFEQAAHDSGRSAVVCSSNNEVDKQASQVLRLLDQGVAGVVLNPCATAQTPAYQVRMLQKGSIPVVLLHTAIEGINAPLVDLNREEIARRIGRKFGEAGHRRVAIMTSGDREAILSHEQALRREIGQWGGTLPDSHVLCGGMPHFSEAEYIDREQCVERLVDQLLGLPDRPTAVFITFESVAEIAYLILQRKGLRIPEEISLMTFGIPRRDGAIMRRLTAVTVDINAAIRQAVQFLEEIRKGKRSIESNERVSMLLGEYAGETLALLPAS